MFLLNINMENIQGPVKDIPTHLMAGYTMRTHGANIPIYYELNLSPLRTAYLVGTKSSNFAWSQDYIDSFRNRLQLKKIKDNNYDMGTPYGRDALQSLIESFEKYDISNKNVAVVGSETPWIEAVLLNLGNHVTTVDYNVPTTSYNKLTVIDNTSFQASDQEYDCVVTFSSIEHSGLGRYGDTLDPDGDLKAMRDIHGSLKPSGICMWGAPVGFDAVIWNAHRVYGPIRLPLMFKDFHEEELIHTRHTRQSLFAAPYDAGRRRNAPQPVIVLRKKQ